MQTMYIGQEKFIIRGLRYYRFTEESHDAVVQIDWAEGVLNMENCIYPNGRNSHECALEILEKFEDVLIDYLVV